MLGKATNFFFVLSICFCFYEGTFRLFRGSLNQDYSTYRLYQEMLVIFVIMQSNADIDITNMKYVPDSVKSALSVASMQDFCEC
jgi:hypothetical protein